MDPRLHEDGVWGVFSLLSFFLVCGASAGLALKPFRVVFDCTGQPWVKAAFDLCEDVFFTAL